MQFYQSFYEFNILINHYNSDNQESFNKKFNDIFYVTSDMAKQQLDIIKELLDESSNTHEYVTQILLENVEQIKKSPKRTKVKNLLDELSFAQLAYKESFEKDATEIDDIENLLIDWNRLLKLNKQLCVFMFAQSSFAVVKTVIEMLITAKDIMTNNVEVLTQPLASLYKRQEQNLALFNSICMMNKNASNIHKKY